MMKGSTRKNKRSLGVAATTAEILQPPSQHGDDESPKKRPRRVSTSSTADRGATARNNKANPVATTNTINELGSVMRVPSVAVAYEAEEKVVVEEEDELPSPTTSIVKNLFEQTIQMASAKKAASSVTKSVAWSGRVGVRHVSTSFEEDKEVDVSKTQKENSRSLSSYSWAELFSPRTTASFTYHNDQKIRTPMMVVLGVILCFILTSTGNALSSSTQSLKSILSMSTTTTTITTTNNPAATYSHVIAPPARRRSKETTEVGEDVFAKTPTLRQFLLDPEGFHLAMAPAFFGFYGYFGALAAWDESLSSRLDTEGNNEFNILLERINSLAGASAGAMAAVLLAEGVPPRVAAEFCSTITLDKFGDFPGIGALFRGHLFEQIMYDFLREQTSERNSTLQLQDSIIPVAVTGFDLHTFQGKILRHGSMARAARASATFPFLFQPIGWQQEVTPGSDVGTETNVNQMEDYLLIDGGLADVAGLNGLSGGVNSSKPKRVVNLVIGDFLGGTAPGPSDMPPGLVASEVVSISIRNLPKCGPWAMENGPLAVEAASRVMKSSLDVPLYRGGEKGHYELHLDASSFIPTSN